MPDLLATRMAAAIAVLAHVARRTDSVAHTMVLVGDTKRMPPHVQAHVTQVGEPNRPEYMMPLGLLAKYALGHEEPVERVRELEAALRELIEDYEEADAYPTSDQHPLYRAREVLTGNREALS